MSARRIFVQIPAYLDTELASTLRDLYRKAAEPETLRTVVLWQHDEGQALPADVLRLPGLTIIETDAAASRGPNWARRRLGEELADEPYSLLLDSHHRFAPGWDAQVVGMHEGLVGRGIPKPLVTSYLPAYLPGAGARSRQQDPYVVSPMERDDGVLTRLTSHPLYRWEVLEAPVRGTYVSLHFLFSSSDFTREVPIDPAVYFFGDEIALSVRAFTYGWDVYHPHRILGWHAYDRASREPHWERHREWGDAQRASLARQRSLYTGGSDTAQLRGSARSVADFEAHALHRLVVAA
ncbi:GlcNAc-transferase family protein [Microbacterium sp. B2969]|uniref:GlcNAc-transferase family protein n=1 Tax=Microbacterium alkaliflavum TaxID=3248839 RepID=A0ABW7QAM2_9MICO